MDTALKLSRVGSAGISVYSLSRNASNTAEAVNLELAHMINDVPRTTDEGFRKSQIFHDARMFDPEVECSMVVAPRNFRNLFTKKSIS